MSYLQIGRQPQPLENGAVPFVPFPVSADERVPTGDEGSDHESDATKTPQHRIQPPWQTGVWARFPWTAAIGVLLIFVFVGSMLAIAIAADGTSVASWKVSPTVLFAIASAAVTILLNFTLVRGAAVRWWFMATHRPSRVQDLHWRWAASQGVFDAGLSVLFRGPSIMAIASSFVTLAAINSPLLQRALSVETRMISNVVDLDVYAAPRLPRGFTVYVSDDSQELHVPTEEFSTVMREYLARTPIRIASPPNSSLDDGTYRTHIDAAGYTISCNESTIDLPNFDAAGGPDRYTDQSTPVFISSVTYTEEESHQHISSIIPSIRDGDAPPADHASLRLFTYDAQWKPARGCINATNGAALRKRQCNITPATVRYAVVISNGTVSLDPATTYADDVAVANETLTELRDDVSSGNSSTHGGVALLLDLRFAANYSIIADANFLDVGGLWNTLAKGLFAYELATAASSCDRRFEDPGRFAFGALRELALRCVLRAAGAPVFGGDGDSGISSTNITAQEAYRQTLRNATRADVVVAVYVTNRGFLAGAVAASLLAATAVLPLFYGFWALGRRVSMSPVEIARAFGPVELNTAPSNATARGVLKIVGRRPVRYGMRVDGSESAAWESGLGMGEPGVTVTPGLPS